VAKEKLIPQPPDTDKTGPKGRFSELGAKVFGTSKAEIDRREKEWRDEQSGPQSHKTLPVRRV
jgi:hypothetical protein